MPSRATNKDHVDQFPNRANAKAAPTDTVEAAFMRRELLVSYNLFPAALRQPAPRAAAVVMTAIAAAELEPYADTGLRILTFVVPPVVTIVPSIIPVIPPRFAITPIPFRGHGRARRVTWSRPFVIAGADVAG